MDEKGSVTIISLIIFSFIMLVIVFMMNMSEIQGLYNNNTGGEIQHGFILESHYNYLMNKEKYSNELEDSILSILETSKKDLTNILKIDEVVKDNGASQVKMIYRDEDNEAIIYIENGYQGIERGLKIGLNPINDIYIDNDGLIEYVSDDNKIVELFSKLDNMEKNLDGILYSKDDILINEDLEFEGIMISSQGKIRIEEGKQLDLVGLVISRDGIEGNYNITKDFNIIKQKARYLPDFLDYDVKYRVIMEGFQRR